MPRRGKTELDDVFHTIENEGFDYAFRNYSDFHEVNDPKFHELRVAYVKAAQELETYVGECTCEDED